MKQEVPHFAPTLLYTRSFEGGFLDCSVLGSKILLVGHFINRNKKFQGKVFRKWTDFSNLAIKTFANSKLEIFKSRNYRKKVKIAKNLLMFLPLEYVRRLSFAKEVRDAGPAGGFQTRPSAAIAILPRIR